MSSYFFVPFLAFFAARYLASPGGIFPLGATLIEVTIAGDMGTKGCGEVGEVAGVFPFFLAKYAASPGFSFPILSFPNKLIIELFK